MKPTNNVVIKRERILPCKLSSHQHDLHSFTFVCLPSLHPSKNNDPTWKAGRFVPSKHKKKRSKNNKNRFQPQTSKRKITKNNHRCGDHSPSCHHCPQRQTITSNTTSATTTTTTILLLNITITIVNRATTVVMTAQRTTHSFTCPRR